MIYEYHKSKLKGDARGFYADMLKAFSLGRESVTLAGGNVDDVSAAYKAICNDHPELFYVSYNTEIRRTSGFGTSRITLTSRFIYTKKEIEDYGERLDEVFETVRAGAGESDEDKERAVCDYILANVRYAQNDKTNQNAVAALVKGEAQCSGISRAVKYLLDRFGIECVVATGDSVNPATGKKEPHAWNIVKIGGAWRQLDATFMLGSNASKKPPFVYAFFNYSDSQMADTRVIDPFYPRCVLKNSKAVKLVVKGSVKTSGGAVVKSLDEFGSLAAKAIDERASEISFTSAIAIGKSELLNALAEKLKETAIAKNATFAFNFAAADDYVTVRFDWN